MVDTKPCAVWQSYTQYLCQMILSWTGQCLVFVIFASSCCVLHSTYLEFGQTLFQDLAANYQLIICCHVYSSCRFVRVYLQSLLTWTSCYNGMNCMEKEVLERRRLLATSCSRLYVQRLFFYFFPPSFKTKLPVLFSQAYNDFTYDRVEHGVYNTSPTSYTCPTSYTWVTYACLVLCSVGSWVIPV